MARSEATSAKGVDMGKVQRVTVDAHLCSGQGRCYVLSPELFSADDDGYCAERGTSWEVQIGQEDSARLAVESCPEGAIALEEAP
jgi:ferredoxin